MQKVAAPPLPAPDLVRANELFEESQHKIFCRTDRLFAGLMVVQWLAGIGAALRLSPRSWDGSSSQVHWHIWAAILLGGCITGFPVFLALTQPGAKSTRHVVAIGQMLTSALLIHLTGGRIETHFHVFGSLAFLAFYRDWRVLVTATMVIGADHLVRGVLWPESVFGVISTSLWRALEHAGWVLFEDIFLLISIQQRGADLMEMAVRRASLETANDSIERQYKERSADLEIARESLLESSHLAGMAEMASGILHNVGNVLNSTNVSLNLLGDYLKRSKHTDVGRVADLLKAHKADLAEFLSGDPKGKRVPEFLEQLSQKLTREHATQVAELESLKRNLSHIQEIVSVQQKCSRSAGAPERIKVEELLEDTLRLNAASLSSHQVKVKRHFEPVPAITVDKHKVLQILVNLVCNAKQACEETGQADKQITLSVRNGEGRVKISVSDNGIGIPQDNLSRIFTYGFTTKKNGHGFGLHSGSVAAKEIGGSLTAQSEGPGRGSIFTLEIPCQPPSPQ